MGKRIIECSVSDEYLLGGGVPIGAAGSHDDVVLRLAFGDAWAGLNIYATFTDALGQQSIVVLLLPSMLVPGEAMTYDVPIPAVAKRESGRMLLGLTGYMIVNGNEDMATHTAEAFFRVLPSKVALADDGSVDATLAQQLQDELNKFADVYIEESERQENEIIRQASETEREEAEALRADAETERVAAEADREDAESAREAAENERVIAEGERDEFIGELDSTVDELLKLQEDILDGRAEAVTKEEVIKAINETLLIANDLETNDPYKALSAAQGVLLGGLVSEKVRMESGWYNGTGSATTMSLTFSFVPKLILIVERLYYQPAGASEQDHYNGIGLILTHNKSFVRIYEGTSGVNTDAQPSSHPSVIPSVVVDGTTVTLKNSGSTPANIFNVNSGYISTSNNMLWYGAAEDSGFGYTYYAFG
jgi:hypothetical protein